MCLDTVEVSNKEHIKYGYKIFRLYNNKLYPLWINLPNHAHFNKKQWNVDLRNYNIEADDGKFYECGFHIFENKEDARDYMINGFRYEIYKVEIKDIVASGTQRILCNSTNDYKYVNIIISKKFRISMRINNYEIEI